MTLGSYGGALYTLETHMRYLDEVRAPATLSIESMILGVDAKRLHIGHSMLCEDRVRATVECMLLHYDTRAERPAPFPEPVLDTLREAVLQPSPDWMNTALRRLS